MPRDLLVRSRGREGPLSARNLVVRGGIREGPQTTRLSHFRRVSAMAGSGKLPTWDAGDQLGGGRWNCWGSGQSGLIRPVAPNYGSP